MGRVLGQSKQIALVGMFLSLRNWAFFDAVGIQDWPLPAAVMLPSAWMLPDMVLSLFPELGVYSCPSSLCRRRGRRGKTSDRHKSYSVHHMYNTIELFSACIKK